MKFMQFPYSTGLAVTTFLLGLQGVYCESGFDEVEHYEVPTFTISDLQNGSRDIDFFDTLTTTGLLAIRVPANEPTNVLSELCDCIDSIGPEIHGGDTVLLADGLTTRSTIATATKGTDEPLPLPKNDINKLCGMKAYSNFERARDYVSHATSDAFIPALDRMIEGLSTSTNPILKNRNGKGYSSISSIVADAVNLEHFHSYSKQLSGNIEERAVVDETLSWHTDGGLFLAFLPGQSCNDDKKDESFRLKLHGSNTEAKAIFPETLNGDVVVAIMLGAGAEQWLDTPESLRLRATRHAVKMGGGEERAWYGMMHLVASDAIVQVSPSELTFSEFKKTSSHTRGRRFSDTAQPDEIVVGCGNHNVSESPLATNDFSVTARRRLQHVGGPEDCNNSNNFFCWISCLELPDDKPFNGHVSSGESLYCLNPSVLASTNDLQKAVSACADEVTGEAGSVMDTACGNHWHETEPGIQSYTSLYTEYENASLKYCYGRTGMYMQGFEWEATTCMIYLFDSLVISTRAALIGACIFTIAFGMLVEFVIFQRRSILTKLGKGKKKMVWSALLYGIQLTSSYLVMLVVMTYSGPLFISVIVGLVTGHVVFNWSEVAGKNGSGNVSLEGSTPCCTNALDDDAFRCETAETRTETDRTSETKSDVDTLQNCPC